MVTNIYQNPANIHDPKLRREESVSRKETKTNPGYMTGIAEEYYEHLPKIQKKNKGKIGHQKP